MDVINLIKNDIDNFYRKTNYKKYHFLEHDLFTIHNILKKTCNKEIIERITSYIKLIDKQKELIDTKLKKNIKNNRVYFYFCRHAYSNANHLSNEDYNILEIDAPLTSAGIEYSKNLKVNIKPDIVFSSVLSRSQMTSACLFKQKITVIPFIKEYNYTYDLLNKYYTNQPLMSPYTQYIRRFQGINHLNPDINYEHVTDHNYLYNDITRLSGNINLFLLFLDTFINLDSEKTIFIVSHFDTMRHFGEQFNKIPEIKNNSIFTLNKKGEKGVELNELVDLLFNEQSLSNYEFVKVNEDYDFDRTKYTSFNDIDQQIINNLNFI